MAPLQLQHRARCSPKLPAAPPFPPECGASAVPGRGYITQPGSQPDPPSDHSRAHHGWKVRVHKSQPAQSIKSAHSDNFMEKMDSRQVRGCCQGGWMPVEGRAELWSSRDRLALPAEPPAPPPSPTNQAQPVRGSALSRHPRLLGGHEGAVPGQDEALQHRLREQSTRVVPCTRKMIRERERRVSERSLTFTNHQVWRGSKDRSRLAAGLSRTAGTAQQVPPCCQPRHAASHSPPAVGQGREQELGYGPQSWQAPGTGKHLLTDRWTDSRGRMLQGMKPVHHAFLLPKDESLLKHVRGVRGCSLMLLLVHRERTSRAGGEACASTHTPQPPARTHRGPRPAS